MNGHHNKKLFLSAVSSEFVSYRNLLSQDLKRPNLDVAVQEDFGVHGQTTLEKLDDYIRRCDAVVHLIGKATGAVPEEAAVAALLAKYSDFGTRLPPLAEHLAKPQPGFSYTQWEAYLAIYHGRHLFVYRPNDFELDALDVPRDKDFQFDAAQAQSQKEHYQRISALGQDRGEFLNQERLSSAVLRDLVEILPRLESTAKVRATKLRHTAERLIGRDEDLTRLDDAWNDPHKNVVIIRAWGGVGKTSLVATWMAELALKNWRGAEQVRAEQVYDWSFYSQGTRDQSSASADTFIADALRTFGDPDPTLGSPWDRGARLAQLVGRARCLLVLDGLEPLQHPPGPMHGQLKDPGVSALLKGLAAQNAGLCVVTTREKVEDIRQHYGRTADDVELSFLTDLGGAALLHYAGAKRAGAKEIAADDKELQAASREVHGHGLTLQLLGQYLQLVEDGDILKRDTVRLAEADKEYQNDATRPYGHAFKAMEAYEKWFAAAGEQGQRQLAILRMLGLFDRPASRGCIDALRAEPVIDGLTESLVGLSPRDWKLALSRLEEINLLAVQDDGFIDCHPLLREYFARQLQVGRQQALRSSGSHDDDPGAARDVGDQDDGDAGTAQGLFRPTETAWREGHRRLYEYFCEATKEGDQPTLEDLQPLYQAVAHGCQAGLQQEACDEIYKGRILRGTAIGGYYSTNRLGAFGADLGAVACFFETPWSRVSPSLPEAVKSGLLATAAFHLRALGRLTEALQPMRVSGEMDLKVEKWTVAALRCSNLSELELALGEVADAVADGEQSAIYADRSGDEAWQSCIVTRTAEADALHQAGRQPEAEARFREAEQIQAEHQPTYPLLYSVRGFRYCDLLLTEAERAAWKIVVFRSALGAPDRYFRGAKDDTDLLESCRGLIDRASRTLTISEDNNLGLLSIALDHLTLGRAAFYAAILEQSENQYLNSEVNHAVDGLRRAGQKVMLPHGLLTRAFQRFLTGARTGPDSAQSDLDEAWEIAERGPMRLFMADVCLYRARLFGRHGGEEGRGEEERCEGEEQGNDSSPTPLLSSSPAYPWESPEGDLKEARRLIEKCGYWRRKEELEDAEAVFGLQ